MSSRIGRPDAARKTLIEFGPPGYANCHIHFFAWTYTSIASAGGVASSIEVR